MARRRSLTRRWSRRSINGSAVLDQDSNYIDEEDDTYWRHLPNQTRYSYTTVNVSRESREAFLNSNSRIIDDDDIEATEWWNHLQKTSQDLLVPKTTARTEVSNSDLVNVSNATSHSDAHSITEVIKKKRVMLGAKRKSSGKNPFSQALDLSDITLKSEPISSLKRKNTSQNLSRSIEEGVRRSKRFRISHQRNSPDSNTSTDTEKRSKARPLLFRRPKRKSSSAFDKILLEDDSIVGPSQLSNANINKTLDDGNKIQENNEDTNKTKEFMTQPRSPFDKLRRSLRKTKSTIIAESQQDEDHEEIVQIKDQRSINTTVEGTDHNTIHNSIDNVEKTKEIITKMQSSVGKIKRAPQKSIYNSMNDEKNEIFGNVKIIDSSIKSSGKNSNKQSSDSDKKFKLQLSDRSISENDLSEKDNNEADSPLEIDDRSSPIRSRRNLQISSLSSSESEIIETRKSKQINDDLSDQNNVKPIENIRNESKPKESRSKLLSINQELNAQREELNIVNPENETHQENLSENTSSTESLFEVQKSGYQSSGAQQEQLNSQSLLHQDESANRESEREMESEVVENNEGSDNMSAKSIQELESEDSQINNKNEQQSREMISNRISIDKTKRASKRQLTKVSVHYEKDEKESKSKEKRSILHRKSQGSPKEKIIENSLNNDMEESRFKNRRLSNNKNSISLKQQITQEMPLVHEDEEQLESEEDTKNNNAKKTSKSFSKRRTQLNSSINEDKENGTEKSRTSLKNRTKAISSSHRNEEQESDEENDEAKKSRTSLKNRTKAISSSHRNEEQESDEENDEAKKSQTSLKNRTKKISSSHRNKEQESDEENDEAKKSRTSLKNRTKKISSSHRNKEQESDEENDEAKKSRTSLKNRTKAISSSHRNEEQESDEENDEAKKSRTSLKNRTKKISSSHRNKEQESDEENDEAKKSRTSLKNRTKAISSSHRNEEQESDEENDEAKKSRTSLKNRTKKISSSHRNEEQESDEENDEAEKSRTSLKNRQTQLNSLIDEDESEMESTEETENITEDIQESIKQRKLSSIASISRKLFSENLEDRSSIMTESSKRSRESSRSNRIIDPSAYELPNRTRSDSYSESDTDNVRKDPIITDDEPMQLITENNINLPGPSTSAQTPLPSSLIDQRSKLLKRSEPLKMNTLDRYLMNSRSKLASNHPHHIGRSEDDVLSQKQLQELGDKLKKIKEKTDKITEKEVKQVQERTAKLQNSVGTRPTVRNNLRNLKNKNKTPKAVNQAYIVDGQVYKQPKLPRPQKWATNRLYKYLWKKMEPKYNIDTRIKSEKFVIYLSDVVKVIKRRKKFVSYEQDLNELIKKMAQLGIIETRMDFHNFCYDFLPYEFRVKVTPMLMPGNVRNIPFDPDTLTVPIINKQ